jgi:hypothetical protein
VDDTAAITLNILYVLAIVGLSLWPIVWFFKKIGEIAATLRRIEGHVAGLAVGRQPERPILPIPRISEPTRTRPLRPGLNLD